MRIRSLAVNLLPEAFFGLLGYLDDLVSSFEDAGGL
jgi:hypothetical protein